MDYFSPGIDRGNYNPRSGFSVRCLRDAEILEVQGCTDPAYIEYDATANSGRRQLFDARGYRLHRCCLYRVRRLGQHGRRQLRHADSTCTDVEMDGHTYAVVEIGDQCWFAENLRTTVYGNGDVILRA